jgi:hypothetical protein
MVSHRRAAAEDAATAPPALALPTTEEVRPKVYQFCAATISVEMVWSFVDDQQAGRTSWSAPRHCCIKPGAGTTIDVVIAGSQ